MHVSRHIKRIYISLFAVIPFLLSGLPVHAFEPYISTYISPAYPHPFETFTVELSSYTTDLDQAYITWSIDGIVQASDYGMKTFQSQAGASGVAQTISAAIAVGNESYIKSFTVTPGKVDIFWEAIDASTPPFYRGKALPAAGGVVRVFAIPDITNMSGERIAPDTFDYTWSRNGFTRDVRNQSGYGKSTLSLRKDILTDNETVTVLVESQSLKITGSASIVIPATEPEIIFYAQHPLYGTLYASALEGPVTIPEGEETTIIAEPYFFSRDNMSDLSFEWFANGKPATPRWDYPNALTIEASEGARGIVPLSITISSPEHVLQSITESLSLLLQNSSEATFF
jgi:hypothetical protein